MIDVSALTIHKQISAVRDPLWSTSHSKLRCFLGRLLQYSLAVSNRLLSLKLTEQRFQRC